MLLYKILQAPLQATVFDIEFKDESVFGKQFKQLSLNAFINIKALHVARPFQFQYLNSVGKFVSGGKPTGEPLVSKLRTIVCL